MNTEACTHGRECLSTSWLSSGTTIRLALHFF